MIDESAPVYAKAMFDVAEETETTDEVLAQFSEVVKTIKENKDLSDVLKTPFILDDDKKAILEKIFSDTTDIYLINFLKVLIDRKKIRYIDDVYHRFVKLVNDKKTLEKGTVYSVVALSDEEIKELEAKMSKKFSRVVKLENKIDKSLMGGVFIKIGNKEIDGTVRSRINGLKKELSKMI